MYISASLFLIFAACLQPFPGTVDIKSKASIREYYQVIGSIFLFIVQDKAYSSAARFNSTLDQLPKNQFIASDIDIFLYGLTPKEATQKVPRNFYEIDFL